MSYRSTRRRILAVVLAICAALPASVATFAQAPVPQPITAVPATAIASSSRDVPAEHGFAPKASTAGNQLASVIVKLDVAPLAAYRGGIPGLAATSPQLTGAPRLDLAAPASQRYLNYLDGRLRDFEAAARAAIPQARVTARYRVVYGGAALVVPADQVAQVARLPGVVAVQPDERYYPLTDRSPQFIGADVIWRALARDPALGDGGQGVIVGVIDTGIWPEHPSFADDGSYPPPPPWWRGVCAPPNDTSPPIACTNKLIGARVFLDAYKALVGLGPGEYDSARDNEGHGTHTASTAAGNASVAAEIFGVPRGQVSGIAPRAHIAAYKGLGSAGGFSSDLVAAIDQAVADGVDVINFSIGSITAPDPYEDSIALAFLDAYRAGVFVAVSAGNAGPGPGTIGSPANAPWVMSVAASTHDRQFISRLTLQAGDARLEVRGASITPGVSDKPVIDAATLGDQRCEDPLPAAVAGKIVLCQRGGNARVEKSANVLAGGGAGMILYNPTIQDVETDNHWVPTIHLDGPEGAQVVAFTNAHSDTTVLGTISLSEATIDPRFGDVLAAFSSRGPLEGDQGGVIKPDVAAPGVQILAGHSPAPNDVVAGPPGELFQAIAGTSMSAPHVAGAAALLKALHPNWTPGQIKSALMTTANTNVVKEDGSTSADPYDVGAGRIDLTRAGDPGLTLDIPADAYASARGHLDDLNYPSIAIPTMPGRISVVRTVHSELSHAATWRATAEAPPGVTITVNPERIRVPAGGYASFVITIDAGGAPDGSYFAQIRLRSEGRVLHLPLTFTRSEPVVALDTQCNPATIRQERSTTCTIAATNNGPTPAGIAIRDAVPEALQVRRNSVSGATLDRATNTLTFAGTLAGVTPAQIDVVSDPGGLPLGYVSLAGLGIPPNTCTENCDEVAITFIAPPFTYGGQTYDLVTMVTNGYLIVGGAKDIRFFNQELPDPATPNNVIAPYWTDLDLDGTAADDGGGGSWYAAYVTIGTQRWFVGEWADAALYGADPASSHHTFQVWIAEGSDRIHMVYGPNSPTEDTLTVGAENADGTAGDNYYVDTTRGDGANGRGTPPVEGDLLKVNHTPEQRATHTISFRARGETPGTHVNIVELTANTFRGTNIATATVTIERR